MNQSLIFNDDFTYSVEQQAWTFSALHAGAKLVFAVKEESNTELSQSQKFDFEMRAEQWLEENEIAPDNFAVLIFC